VATNPIAHFDMPIFFATAADFRVWLARHAASES